MQAGPTAVCCIGQIVADVIQMTSSTVLTRLFRRNTEKLENTFYPGKFFAIYFPVQNVLSFLLHFDNIWVISGHLEWLDDNFFWRIHSELSDCINQIQYDIVVLDKNILSIWSVTIKKLREVRTSNEHVKNESLVKISQLVISLLISYLLYKAIVL